MSNSLPQAVFLDDLGVNLKAARAMGMATIKVQEVGSALAELERLVGVSLSSEGTRTPQVVKSRL